jgi:PAS domain S-box-containing protein
MSVAAPGLLATQQFADARFNLLLETMNDGFIETDDAAAFVYVNPRFAALLGYAQEDLIDQPARRFMADAAARLSVEHLAKRKAGLGEVYELNWLHRDGHEIATRVSASPHFDAHANFVGSTAIVTDLTETKRAEADQQRADRALRLLNICDGIMIRAKDEEQMLSDTCRAVVEIGGYRLAWVGYARQNAEKSVQPIAFAGQHPDYVQQANISWGDTERGRGPTGVAIRTGSVVIARDTETQPDYGPWQQAARERGFRSTLTLPLRQDGRSFGALMIYADQPDRFDESETRLLCLLADDLAFGISALRNAVHRSHLAAALNCAGDAIISFKFSGIITSWNKAAEDLFGHTAAEAIGSAIKIVVPADRTEEYQSLFERFRHGESIVNYDTIRIAKDGRRIPVSLTLRRIDGALRRGVVVYRDITHRKQTEAALRAAANRFRNLIEASLDPLVTINPEGQITDVNKSTEQATGKSREQLIGTDFSSYFTEPERAREGYRRAFAEGAVTDYPLTMRHVSGSVNYVVYNASVFHDEAGEVAGVFAAARDVTRRKLAEAELAEYQQHLEELIAERTRDLAHANEALQAANLDLEAFAYSVSHDLRAPLRAVDGFSRILQQDYGERLDDEGRRLVQVVRDGAQRMGRLIADILDFSRIGRRVLTHTVAQMGDLVSAVLQDLAPDLQGRDLTFVRKELPPVNGDNEMLQLVWMNLLQNAIKYTGKTEGGLVEIGARQEAAEIVYFVRDNGAGFNMQYASKLFGTFQRLHASTDFPGTGIGLAIVKRIISRHGGRVWAEGKVNEGATFYFALPAVHADLPVIDAASGVTSDHAL